MASRLTYKGRLLKVLAARGKPHHRKMVINGHTVHYAWQGNDEQALTWFKNVIDKMDAAGPGRSTLQPPYERHWWEPGTFDVNPAGHVTPPGGICLCKPCIIDDPCGSKGRYAPLHPDACQHCHQIEAAHDNDVFLDWHRYTQPTEQQRAGRQAAIDEFQQDDDPDEATCDAIYPKKVPGYLGPARCLSFIDHRDATDPDFHEDARGFRWARETARRVNPMGCGRCGIDQDTHAIQVSADGTHTWEKPTEQQIKDRMHDRRTNRTP